MTHAVKEYAETATAVVRQTLPRNLPKVELPGAFQKPVRAKRGAAKARKARAAKPAKRAVKRGARRATKSA